MTARDHRVDPAAEESRRRVRHHARKELDGRRDHATSTRLERRRAHAEHRAAERVAPKMFVGRLTLVVANDRGTWCSCLVRVSLARRA